LFFASPSLNRNRRRRLSGAGRRGKMARGWCVCWCCGVRVLAGVVVFVCVCVCVCVCAPCPLLLRVWGRGGEKSGRRHGSSSRLTLPAPAHPRRHDAATAATAAQTPDSSEPKTHHAGCSCRRPSVVRCLVERLERGKGAFSTHGQGNKRDSATTHPPRARAADTKHCAVPSRPGPSHSQRHFSIRLVPRALLPTKLSHPLQNQRSLPQTQ
jgi:hypothetical protein